MSDPACTGGACMSHRIASIAEPTRARLVARNIWKWAGRETVRYMFMEAAPAWRGSVRDKDAVRAAFAAWQTAAPGLRLVETGNPMESPQIRIGFDRRVGKTTWSKIGKEAVETVKDPRQLTMNFAMPLSDDKGRYAALHEVGHALGFSHEHQNPRADIIWNMAGLREHYLIRERWTQAMLDRNITDRWAHDGYGDWDWDPHSVMNYRFPAGVVASPKAYDQGLSPPASLSEGDKARARAFYPPPEAGPAPTLTPFQSKILDLKADEPVEFEVMVATTRVYTIETIGELDAALTVFEDRDGVETFLIGDDNSGPGDRAVVKLPLVAGRRYVVRLRMHYAARVGETGLLLS